MDVSDLIIKSLKDDSPVTTILKSLAGILDAESYCLMDELNDTKIGLGNVNPLVVKQLKPGYYIKHLSHASVIIFKENNIFIVLQRKSKFTIPEYSGIIPVIKLIILVHYKNTIVDTHLNSFSLIKLPISEITKTLVGFSNTILTHIQKRYLSSLKTCVYIIIRIINNTFDMHLFNNGMITLNKHPYYIRNIDGNIKCILGDHLNSHILSINIHEYVPEIIVCDKDRIVHIIVNLINICIDKVDSATQQRITVDITRPSGKNEIHINIRYDSDSNINNYINNQLNKLSLNVCKNIAGIMKGYLYYAKNQFVFMFTFD